MALATLFAWEPLSRDELDAYGDWDRHVFYAEAATRAVWRFGEFPLWNPYSCGGTPLLGHPESRVLTPFFLLHLVLAPARALPWDIALHYLLAAAGMALFVARLLRDSLSRWASMLGSLSAASVYAGSTVFPLHLAEGHFEWLAAAYAPWVLLFFDRSLERPRDAASAGLFFALVICEGGTYPAAFLSLWLVFQAAVLGLAARRKAPLQSLALTFGFAFLFASPKLLPMLEFLGQRPRPVPSPESLSLSALAQALVGRDQSFGRAFDGQLWGWHEYGHYVGVAGLALAAAGALASSRRAKLYVGLALVFLLLAAGRFGALAPWAVLHDIGPFRGLHVSSRFLLMVVLAIAVLAGLGVERIARTGGRSGVALGALAVTLLAADMVWVRWGVFGLARCPLVEWPAWATTSGSLVTARRPPREAYCAVRSGHPPRFPSSSANAARAGFAIIDAYEPLCPRESDRTYFGRSPGLVGLGEEGYRGEAWFSLGDGAVEVLARSQNRVSLRVRSERGGVVTLAQNWDAGWSADEGRALGDEQGRLAVRVEPSTRVLQLRYRPRSLMLGIGLGLLGLGLATSLWVHKGFTRREVSLPTCG